MKYRRLGRTKVRQWLLEVEAIKQTELPAGVPLASWALAWCLRNPVVSSVIPGCKDPGQVELNASAANLELDSRPAQRHDLLP